MRAETQVIKHKNLREDIKTVLTCQSKKVLVSKFEYLPISNCI